MIHSDIAPGLPSIDLDRNALSQALNNLVDNAEKFSQDKRKIDINTRRDNEYIVISVTDYGIGIPQAEIDKIFDVTRLNELGLSCDTPLEDGLRRTIEWFLKAREEGTVRL